MQILLYSSPRLSPAGVATNSELSPSSVGKTEYRIKQPLLAGKDKNMGYADRLFNITIDIGAPSLNFK